MVEIFVTKQPMVIQVVSLKFGEVVLVKLHHMLNEQFLVQSGFEKIYLHVIFLKHNGDVSADWKSASDKVL